MRLPKFSEYFVSRSEYDTIKRTNELLKGYFEISKMGDAEVVKEKVDIPVAGFDTTDEEPTDPLARKQYLMDVDYFMDNVLNRKLKCSIADIREMLSNIGVARGLPQNMQRNEYDFFLRGMEAFAWKMHEWATLLQAERRSSLQDKENNNGSI